MALATELRGTVMPRLRKVAGMCSSKVAEMRICGYRAEEKILCRSPISQRSHVGNLRQTLQGKGVIHKRVETAGVYPLMLPRRVPQSPAASAAVPRCATAHSSPRNGEPFTRFGHTGKSVPRNLRSKSARRSALPTFSLVQCRKMRYTYFI